MRSAALFTVAAWLLIGAVPPAVAQTEPDANADQAKQAAAKYKDGLKFFEDQKFTEALALFREAFAVTKSPNAQLMVGLCLKQLGQPVEAYRELTQVIQEATARNEAKYQKSLETAQTEIAGLEGQVGKLTITLPEQPPGLALKLDGETLSVEALAAPVVVKPGEHEIVATADGRAPFTRKLQVDGGATQSVEVKLAEAPSAVAPPPAAPPPPPPPPPSAHGLNLRTAGFITAGVGVVAFGVFATTGLMAKSKWDKVNEACGGRRCRDSKYASDIDSGKSLQTMANVSLIVGAVGVVAGAGLIVFGGPKEQAAPPVAASVLPGGGFVSYAGRF
jgi:hypothetical protein